jgi:hypothetical protein
MADAASILPLITGAAQGAGGYASYNAQLAQGRYASSAANINAQTAAQQAQEAEAVGNVQAQRRLKQGALDAAEVRNSVTSGDSAARAEADARIAAIEDAATLRHNAALQAWGLGMESNSYRTQGRLAKIGARNEASQSLISGGLGFARGVAEANYNANYDRNGNKRVK